MCSLLPRFDGSRLTRIQRYTVFLKFESVKSEQFVPRIVKCKINYFSTKSFLITQNLEISKLSALNRVE